MKDFEKKLDKARQNLLDLGLRNPLISFKSWKSTLPIVDELSEEILRILVTDLKAMSFSALPSSVEKELEETDSEEQPDWADIFSADDPPEDGGLAERHTDTKLQTNLPADALTLRLIKINSTATTYIQEQGVNVLYLALGFLNWFQDPRSEIPRKAPLILIPVQLDRSNASQRFKVRYSGDDVGDNLSLKAKLKGEFDISLPDYDVDSGESLSSYMQKVATAVERETRWSITPDGIHLGFFSFGKFLMYNDLAIASWSSSGNLENHPLISPLLGDGFREPNSTVPDDAHLDAILAPGTLHTVMDADSSQTKAILDVKDGRNLVIQGPPGTGKSQTITNIIAEALGSGKKVLFVSEKMAALDVVKRRLDAVGIGDAALEIHSHKTNKKLLAKELDRTLQLGRPQAGRDDDDIALLTRLRDQLNAYCEAANEPVNDSGITPIDALGHILALVTEGSTAPRFSFNEMRDWSAADFRDRKVLVGEMARKLDQMGRPIDSPFWGSQLEYFDPMAHQKVARALKAGIAATNTLRSNADELASRLRFETPASMEEITVLCRAARRAMDAPHDVFSVHLSTGDWQARRDDLKTLIEAGKAAYEIASKYGEDLIPEAWDQDLLEVRQHFSEYGPKWWCVLSGKFRQSRSRLRDLSKVPIPKAPEECLVVIDAIMAMRRHREVISQHATLGSALFRGQWQGLDSDWLVLEKISEWVVDLYREIGDGQLPPAIVDFLEGSPSLAELSGVVDNLERAQIDASDALKETDELLENDAEHRIATTESSAKQHPTLDATQSRLDLWLRDLDALQRMTEFNRIAKEFRKAGISLMLEKACEWEAGGTDLARSFELTWYEGIYQLATSDRPALRSFDRTSHEHAIETFRSLDAMLLTHVRNRLIKSHWDNLPKLGESGELGIIKKEINKKRRHLSIRGLMTQAGRAVQAIKPLFMMSPMSIAMYLPPGSVNFDLVIFDEASQVKPVDAFGALLRSTQAVVVGDSKQLPPTSFFDSEIGPDEDDESEALTSDSESILGLFNAQSAPSRMLRWHYRSRHESLIAVSNHELYDDRLVVFPSSGQDSAAAGLTFEHLPSTEYDRGRSASNRGEAKAVVEAVFQHARDFPDLTLGVVAFSKAQRDAVEIELEARRRQDPSCEDFFSSHEEEPFFVKNLENVQGDERDVIFISAGYGKTADGYLAMNFGPVNREGGERRLNVLFSRARMSCRVFSNFTADDIDLSRSNSRGVAVLKAFMQYAETRILDIPKITGRAPDSPFEEQVLSKLTSRGLDLEPQVGVAGFFIDLAVRDPEKPGRFLLGIECDGATYHSARSARDRDRLREAVLRGLGWEIHRIWSSDWFRNPERETDRVLQAVEEAKLSHARTAARSRPAPPPIRSQENSPVRSDESKQDATATKSSTKAYVKAQPTIRLGNKELHEIARGKISEWIIEIVKVEGPVHSDEAIRRVAGAAGYARIGSRIQNILTKSIDGAHRAGRIERRGSFLWTPGSSDAPARNRVALDNVSKKIEFTCDEEIESALLEAVSAAFSMSELEAVSVALSNLGHRRPSVETRRRVDAILDRMKSDRRVGISNNRITPPDGGAANGVEHGQGTHTDADGTKQSGEWKGGDYQGDGTHLAKRLGKLLPTGTDEFVEFCCDHTDLFVRGLFHHYPLPAELLSRYENVWSWFILSENTALPWNEALISQFEDKWHWKALSSNRAVPWSEALFARYKDRWDWDRLSENRVPFNESIATRFQENWNWHTLGRNPHLKWNESLLEVFEQGPALPSSHHPYKQRDVWEQISGNESIPWTSSLIDRFRERWNWGRLSRNKALPWTDALIENYDDDWDWFEFSQNPALPWNEQFITNNMSRFMETDHFRGDAQRWWWFYVAGNEGLPWTEEFIERHSKMWAPASTSVTSGWRRLSGNKKLPWSEALIARYAENWDWEWLSKNTALPWDEGLIERFNDRWDWGALSMNAGLPWSQALLSSYKSNWNWESLCWNETLPWTIDLIKANPWDFELAQNKSLWEKVFDRKLNDGLVEQVMERIPMEQLQEVLYGDPEDDPF